MSTSMDVASPRAGFWQRLGRRLRLNWEDWRAGRALRRELAALESVHQLGATLEDLRLTRSRRPSRRDGIVRHDRRFRGAAGRDGIDGRTTDRAAFNGTLWACADCRSDGTCRRWLEAGCATGTGAFCSNGAPFAVVAAANQSTPLRARRIVALTRRTHLTV